MAVIQAILDGARPYGIAQKGFGFDTRPGVNPEDWNFTNTYAWPVPGFPSPLTLMPAHLDPLWPTSADDTSIYRRMKLEHLEQTVPNSWEQYERITPKDWVMLSKINNAPLLRHIPLDPLDGITLNVYAFGPSLGNRNMLDVSFGAPGAASGTADPETLTLQVKEDGYGSLIRGNGIASVDKLAEGLLVPNRGGSLLGKWHRISIFPHGRNRILVHSSAGGSFVWENENLSRQEVTLSHIDRGRLPTPPGRPLNIYTFPITKAGPVRINNPTYKLAIQPQSILYAPTGTIVARATTRGASNKETPWLTEQHPAPASPSVGVIFDARSPTHVAVSLSAPYPVGGDLTGYQPTVTLSRPNVSGNDQSYSPQIYRIEPSAPPVIFRKASHAQDVAYDVIEFEQTQDKSGVTGRFKLRHAENHSDLIKRFNIPFQWIENGNEWFQGETLNPKWQVDGASSFIENELVDTMHYLGTKNLGNQLRFDGMGIDDAVKATLIACGFPADGSAWDIDTVPFVIDNSGGNPGVKKKLYRTSKGEADDDPTNLVDVIKSAKEWLEYLIHTYTSANTYPYEWVMGFRPYLNRVTGKYEVRFFFKNPDLFSKVPSKTFYPTQQLAIANGASQAAAYRDVHQAWDLETIPPEFNDLYVHGLDSAGEPLKAQHLYDRKSQNSTLAPKNRPSNWVGDTWTTVYIDAALNTDALALATCKILFKKGSVARQRVSFTAMWEPTLRLWDTVRLYWYEQNGNTSTLVHGNFLITGFPVHHIRDLDPPVRTARYLAERILV